MGYKNPLLSLPAIEAFTALPQEARCSIVCAVRALRAEANAAAESAWRNKPALQTLHLNPLWDFAAGRALLGLPPASRRLLAALCMDIAHRARHDAATSWHRRKAPMALYHRHIGIFARNAGKSLMAGTATVLRPGRARAREHGAAALYCRALSTYARHTAHALSMGATSHQKGEQ
ncbi:MAG TPA: hypothetical protein VEC35_09245 [Noviherbaspirillum sp.]|nr:hypothetical protein [Noviherbaspirillum sp.]